MLPSPSGHRRGAATATTVCTLFATLAVALPAAASAKAPSAKRCPSAGRTLAVERYGKTVTSRVWQVGGRTYGCTLVASRRPRTHLLTKTRTGLVRLQDDTVAWTTPRTVGGATVARVSAYDLTGGRRFLSSARAVPRAAAGVVPQEGTVDQLRVGGGFFVAWVANGDTVVLGADDPGEVALTGPDGPATPLPLSGGLAVAGRYAADPTLRQRLVDSLQVAAVPGDHGDSDDCAYSYETAFRWSTAADRAYDARMSGTRVTPLTCG